MGTDGSRRVPRVGPARTAAPREGLFCDACHYRDRDGLERVSAFGRLIHVVKAAERVIWPASPPRQLRRAHRNVCTRPELVCVGAVFLMGRVLGAGILCHRQHRVVSAGYLAARWTQRTIRVRRHQSTRARAPPPRGPTRAAESDDELPCSRSFNGAGDGQQGEPSHPDSPVRHRAVAVGKNAGAFVAR